MTGNDGNATTLQVTDWPAVFVAVARGIAVAFNIGKVPIALAQFAGPPLIAAIVASSGRWSDTLFVTGGAATIGILLGLAIRRIEPRGGWHT